MGFISPGRTGDVEKVHFGGRNFYVKTNPSARMNDIELRVYSGLREAGIAVPDAVRLDDTRLLVADAGVTMADQTMNGGYQGMRSKDQVLDLVKTRVEVNNVIGGVLSGDDKLYLEGTQKKSLRDSVNKLAWRDLSVREVTDNYWACRAMGAMGFFGERFMEDYTAEIGTKLDQLLKDTGKWVGDNNLWNNASVDGGTLVPFDFNSLRYAPSPVDMTAVAGLYVFPGMLGVCESDEEQRDLVGKIGEIDAPQMSSTDYFNAFMVSALHKNAVIAGYRLQAAQSGLAELKEGLLAGEGLSFGKYIAMKKAFDEIDTHSAVAAFVERYRGDTVFGNENKGRQIAIFVRQNTSGKRIGFIMDDVFQAGQQMFAKWGHVFRD